MARPPTDTSWHHEANQVRAASDAAKVRLGIVKALAGAYEKQAHENEVTKQAISRVQAAMTTGSYAAATRAYADLVKLGVDVPLRIAKMGVAYDANVLNSIADAMTMQFPDAPPTDDDARKFAYKQLYMRLPPTAPTLLGTLQRMEELHGPEQFSDVTPEDGLAYENKQRSIPAKAAQERAFEVALGTWKEKLDPVAAAADSDDPKVLDEQGKALQTVLGRGGGGGKALAEWQKQLESGEAVPDPALQEEVRFLKGELERFDAQPGVTEPVTEQEENWAAAWVNTKHAQEWAASNGFHIGHVVPLTDEMKARIADGSFPGIVTKYGVYVPGRDDEEAMDYAEKQQKHDPQANVFRAIGLGRNTGRRHDEVVQVRLKGATPARVAQITKDKTVVAGARYEGGLLVKTADGSYYASKGEGQPWLPIPAEGASKIAARTGGMQPAPPEGQEPPSGVVEAEVARVPPRVVEGLLDPMNYGDPSGSKRIADPKTGKSQVFAGKDIEAVETLAGGARIRTLAEDIRRARSGRLTKQATGEMENVEVPGPKAKPAREDQAPIARSVVGPGNEAPAEPAPPAYPKETTSVYDEMLRRRAAPDVPLTGLRDRALEYRERPDIPSRPPGTETPRFVKPEPAHPAEGAVRTVPEGQKDKGKPLRTMDAFSNAPGVDKAPPVEPPILRPPGAAGSTLATPTTSDTDDEKARIAWHKKQRAGTLSTAAPPE